MRRIEAVRGSATLFCELLLSAIRLHGCKGSNVGIITQKRYGAIIVSLYYVNEHAYGAGSCVLTD